MGLITPVAVSFFAIAMVAFGIQHLVYGEFVTRVVPKLPAWIPWHSFWAYLTGVVLIAAGLAILFRKQARLASSLLGSLFLLSFLALYIPALLVSQPLGGLWTNAGKALALSGGAFLVAGSPAPMIPLSRFFLSAFLILTGVQHFLFVPFVASLVPRWIPGHLFWTYFRGSGANCGRHRNAHPEDQAYGGLVIGYDDLPLGSAAAYTPGARGSARFK